MRTLVSTILACLILACPVVCGAAEAAHGSHRGHPTSAHCPEDGNDCVCRGAVQSSGVQVPHSEAVGLPHFLHVPTDVLAHCLALLASDGHPAGFGGWGGSRTVRALLQNFRC